MGLRMGTPEISVVMTAYNRAGLLPRAVASLVGGGGAGVDWELIIVDDGSSDSTVEAAWLEMIRPSCDGRIRLVTHPNRGLAGARNSGIKSARAGFVTFLDSDDEYGPNHLALRLAHLARGEQEGAAWDLVHGGLKIIGDPTVPDKFDPSRRIAIEDCFVGGTFVIRKLLWERLGGFRKPDYGDDHDFMVRAVEAGASILKVDYPTYIYHRDTAGSLCNER